MNAKKLEEFARRSYGCRQGKKNLKDNNPSKYNEWLEKQKSNPGRFKPGINNAIDRMGGYDAWYHEHCKNMQELGKRRRNDPAFGEMMGAIVSAHWQDPEANQSHRQALKDGWARPGAKERKSKSVKEVLSRPGMLAAHQERARKNGKKSERPCISPEGIFESARSWAEHTGYSRDLFGYRARKMPKEYYYITQEEYVKLTSQNPWE